MKTRMSALFGLPAVALPAIFGPTGCRSCDRDRDGGGGRGSVCCRSASPERTAGTTEKTCPVSGEELGSMGEPVTVKGRTVLVCCQGCVEKLMRDPERYLAGADKAPPRPEAGSTSRAEPRP